MASRSNRDGPEASFLIDECLHRIVAKVAVDHGYEGVHVSSIGLSATPDRIIAAAALRMGRIFVTNNRRDFRALYSKFVRHPGLVVILPSVSTGEQVRLFEKVVLAIEADLSVIDQLVEIDREGRITITPWPQARDAHVDGA